MVSSSVETSKQSTLTGPYPSIQAKVAGLRGPHAVLAGRPHVVVVVVVVVVVAVVVAVVVVVRCVDSVSTTACNGQKCGPTRCLTPGSDPHGTWTGAGSAYNPGDTTTLNCDYGYTPSAEDGESFEAASRMTCGSGGLWEFQGSFAICVKGAPPTPPSPTRPPPKTYHDQDNDGMFSIMEDACGSAKRASVGNCLVCLGRNNAFLNVAKRLFDQFCGGDAALLL
eukprot:COSAG05_NODE_4775_length_1377_cov_2.353659_1_plen_224_part_00